MVKFSHNFHKPQTVIFPYFLGFYQIRATHILKKINTTHVNSRLCQFLTIPLSNNLLFCIDCISTEPMYHRTLRRFLLQILPSGIPYIGLVRHLGAYAVSAFPISAVFFLVFQTFFPCFSSIWNIITKMLRRLHFTCF